MRDIVRRLCAEVNLPKMLKIRQIYARNRIEEEDVSKTVTDELSHLDLEDAIKPGKRIAITCGSRGIDKIPHITRALVDFVKRRGATPFVVPAMGSHGGATAEGQKKLIESYGVTENFIGCPIVSSMETVMIGRSEADPGGKIYGVRIDKNAAEADGIIVVGRVKPHTNYRGLYESGIMKMMAIGLGKRDGADICHQNGFGELAEMVYLFGKTILKNAPVILGFAIVENAYSEICKFVAMMPHEIEKKEPILLGEARKLLPLIFFESTDVLVVDRIGKDISGDGMDPNITGTNPCTPFVEGGLLANRRVILDLTSDTNGQAMGMGCAHVITQRLFKKLDLDATYVNAITARCLDYARIPVIVENDREAIQLALRTCVGHDPDNPRIIRIKDSLHTDFIWISEVMYKEAENNKRVEILSDPLDWPFDENGNLW